MNNDITDYYPNNVIDTCAIWNLLSSKTLFETAKQARIKYCITNFVLYECVYKKRSIINNKQQELIKRFKVERAKNTFRNCSITIEDLQNSDVSNIRKKKSKGEISSMIFAKKTGQAFITDDPPARKLANEYLGIDKVQTIPQLFGYCVYKGLLLDSSAKTVIAEHKELEDSITRCLEKIYLQALKKQQEDNSSTIS